MLRPPTKGEIREWKDSVPVRQMPVAPEEYILRRLKEFDPLLSLRWNPMKNQVSIWLNHPGDPDALPMLVQFPGGRYLPWGPVVDQRVLICLAAGDKRKYKLKSQADEVIDNKEKKKQAAIDKAYEHADPEHLLYASIPQIRDFTSAPFAVQTFVHPDTPLPAQETAP